MAVEIDWFDGPRALLRPWFELAEDSAVQLDAYMDLGRVLVARQGRDILGHAQLVPTDDARIVELKSLAVLEAHRGEGLGRILVEESVARSRGEDMQRMLVSTAAASVGNLRFYQRVGFRMLSVDRDAFTPETGYPDPILIDGIPMCDRVWFSRDL